MTKHDFRVTMSQIRSYSRSTGILKLSHVTSITIAAKVTKASLLMPGIDGN